MNNCKDQWAMAASFDSKSGEWAVGEPAKVEREIIGWRSWYWIDDTADGGPIRFMLRDVCIKVCTGMAEAVQLQRLVGEAARSVDYTPIQATVDLLARKVDAAAQTERMLRFEAQDKGRVIESLRAEIERLKAKPKRAARLRQEAKP